MSKIDANTLASMFPRASAEVIAVVVDASVDQHDAIERLLEMYSSCDHSSPG